MVERDCWQERRMVGGAARAKGHHVVVKPGDRVPIEGLEAIVVTGGGKDITTPLKGPGQPNPACSQVGPRIEDDAEDGRSLGVVIANGKFRFAYFGDMDWNPSYSLFTHHGQSFPKSYGEKLQPVRAGPGYVLLEPVLLFEARSVGRRVAGYRGFVDDGENQRRGEAGHNPPGDFIANIGEARTNKVLGIHLTAHSNGGFEFANMRNQFTKSYAAK
jgi:hypothetical protein